MREQLHAEGLGVRLAHVPHLARRQRHVVQHGQVGEQVELLEHHPGLTADGPDVADVPGELDAVDDDAPLVVLLEAVDAADHRRLARTRRADHDDDLALGDLHRDAVERREAAEALDHAVQLDHHLAGAAHLGGVGEHLGRCCVAVCHRVPTPNFLSSRWLSRLIVMQPTQNTSMTKASVSPVSP